MSKQITRRDFCNGIAIGTGMNTNQYHHK